MARRASDGQEQYQRPGAAGSVLETCGRDRVGTSRELAVAVLPRDPRFPPRERGTGERRDAGRGNSSACRIAAGRRPKIALALRRVAGNWTTKSRSTNRASAAGTARCSRPWTSLRRGCGARCRWSERVLFARQPLRRCFWVPTNGHTMKGELFGGLGGGVRDAGGDGVLGAGVSRHWPPATATEQVSDVTRPRNPCRIRRPVTNGVTGGCYHSGWRLTGRRPHSLPSRK